MLAVVYGRTAVERVKPVAILALLMLLTVDLWQLSIARTSTAAAGLNRSQIIEMSQRFGSALTTYDYAHLSIQEEQLHETAAAGVLARVRGAWPDVITSRAVSIGDVASVEIASLSRSQADAVVKTEQVVRNSYTQGGETLFGVLEVRLALESDRWVVTGYRWAAAPAAPATSAST